MDMMTLAMAKPKKIDLTKYVAEHSDYGAVTFNDMVLNAFAMGGGSATATDNSAFWNDVSTDRPLLFVIDAAALNPGLKIKAGPNSFMKYDDAPAVIEFSFLVEASSLARATVVFGYSPLGATNITVVVEPITVPEA